MTVHADAPPTAAIQSARRHPSAPSSSVFAILFVLCGTLLGIRRAEAPYADSDILWGARFGLDFLRTGALPRLDTYSWTAHDHPWVPNSWGWNFILGVTYRVGGFAGIACLGVLCVAGVCTLLGVAVRRAGGRPSWGAIITQITLGVFALFLYPRAQLTDYAAVLALLLLSADLLRGERRKARRAFVVILAVQAAWMNLHSAALLGPLLILVAGLGRANTVGMRRAAIRLIPTCVAAGGLCLATPYGWSAVTNLLNVRSASAGLITEWQPAGTGSSEQILGLVAIGIGVLAAACAWTHRSYDTLAVLVLLGALTAGAIRFAPMLCLVAIAPLAVAAGKLPARPRFMNAVCALTLVSLAVICVAGARTFASPGAQFTSDALVAKLPANCRLLNDYDIGGAVILQRPDIKVSIDSRNDVYGRAAELENIAVLSTPAAGERYLHNHGVNCVLVPTATPLGRALASSPQWRSEGHDSLRTLFVPSAAPAAR